jgi:hypothetical protein
MAGKLRRNGKYYHETKMHIGDSIADDSGGGM